MGKNSHLRRICIVPEVSGVGGMVSFRNRLARGLSKRGMSITFKLADFPYDALLVIGGTRDLAGIWRVRRRGIQVVQRLDGMNWIHRKVPTGWRHFIRAEYGNLILSLIRRRLATSIIYQSEFSRQWWERIYGRTPTPWRVVHNGVDLEEYTPRGAGEVPAGRVRILLVEGTIGGGYELGLQTAIQMAERLQVEYSRIVEVQVVGRISAGLQQEWKRQAKIQVSFSGQVPGESIPELDRSAHVLYAADLNPACPNSVIEALACGLPVAGFDTGALGEIVAGKAGELVPYGGDPWKLEPPDIEGLAGAVNKVVMDQAGYRLGARQRAEEAFSLDRMVEGYLEAMGR